jgi:hypothetical protein
LEAKSKALKAAKPKNARPRRRGREKGFKLVPKTPLAYMENEMKRVSGLSIELQLDSNLTDIQISADMIASAMESWLVQEQLQRRMPPVIKDFLLKVRARCC